LRSLKIFIKVSPICLLGIFLVAMAHAKNMTEDSKIKWVGKFEQSEKNDLRDFIRQGKKYFVYSRAEPKIIKVDLENDGTIEYIVSSVFKNLPSELITDVFVVVRKNKGRLVANDYKSQLGDPGLLNKRIVYLEDFDGDGLVDIIDQRFFHGSDEDPGFFGFILKNNGNKFSPVYEKESFGKIVLKDLNNDGVKELIEMISVFKMYYTEARWQHIYVWKKENFVKANEDFPGFYLEKLKVYQELLAEFKEANGMENSADMLHIIGLEKNIEKVMKLIKKQ